MKITQEAIVERQTVLHIELEAPDLDKYLDKAYRRVVQRITIPGFRKGKAPRSLLERFIGRTALLEEALDFILPGATTEAVEKQGLEVVGVPQVEVVELDPSVQIKATVPLKPLVELGNYRDLRLQEETVEVTEKQVEEGLEQVRMETAPWEPVERPVDWGDLVTFSITGKTNGKEIFNDDDGLFVPRQGDNRPLPGFSQEVIGISKGETKIFRLRLPEDFRDTSVAGQECEFSVLVKELKEQILPKLDDEFAKGIGSGYETLESLRQKIREDLISGKEQEVRQRYQERLLEAILGTAHIELPPLLIEHEVDHLLESQAKDLQQQKVTMEEYLSKVGKSPEQLREELRGEAKRHLEQSFALSKIAEQEDIKVSGDEIETRLSSIVKSSGGQDKEIRRIFGSTEGKNTIRNMLLNQKIFDRLRALAVGEEVASGEESEKGTVSEVIKEERQDKEEQTERGGIQNAV
ncbi:MAG: trigger factor [Chloroflexi bacterium]|nr:trigger factor [Chloroflexota bacterium]